MKKNISLTILLFVSTALLAVLPGDRLFTITNQSEPAMTDKSTQLIEHIVKRNGWFVPGFNKSLDTTDAQQIKIDGADVLKKKLQPSTEPLVDVEFYHSSSSGQLLISSTLCAVRDIFSYEAANQVFAYETRLVPVRVELNGSRIYTGAMFIFYYYDQDKGWAF